MTAFFKPFKQYVLHQYKHSNNVRWFFYSSLLASSVIGITLLVSVWVPSLTLFWSYYFYGLLFSAFGAVLLQISSIIILKSHNKYCFFCFFLLRMVLYGVCLYSVHSVSILNFLAVLLGIITFTWTSFCLKPPRNAKKQCEELFL